MNMHLAFENLLVSYEDKETGTQGRVYIPSYEITVEGTKEEVGAALTGLYTKVEEAVRRGLVTVPQPQGDKA